MRLKTTATMAGVLACALFAVSANAADVPNHGRLIKSAQNVGVLGKDLAGDSTNFHTGATSFEATDLSVPGNFDLPVAIGRTYGVTFGRMLAEAPGQGFPVHPQAETRKYAFGDWDLDIPFISAMGNATWQIESSTPLQRCSVVHDDGTVDTGTPSNTSLAELPYQGLSLHLPNSDQAMLIASVPNSNRPSTGGPYHWVTNKDWWVSCLSTAANDTGEGFLARGPDGTKYTFNWLSKRRLQSTSLTESMNEDGVSPPFKTYYAYPYELMMLPTRIEDRFGNWVQYTYSSDEFARLQSITASDGRHIDLTWNTQGFVGSINDGVRTVTYQYSGARLTRVVMPDQQAWAYEFGNLDLINGTVPLSEHSRCQQMTDYVNFNCIGYPLVEAGTSTGYVVHPSGARVDFTFAMHYAPTVPVQGSAQFSGQWVFGIVDKTISGPGLAAPLQWHYAFAPTLVETQARCRAGTCPTRLWSDEVTPEFRVTRRMFGLVHNQDDGLQIQELRGFIPTNTVTLPPTSGPRITRAYILNDIDIVEDSTPVSITTQGPPQFFEEADFSYHVGAQLGKHPNGIFPPGVNVPGTSHVFWSERRVPVASKVTYLQGATFSFSVAANGWDLLDRPLVVYRVSSLNPGRVEGIEYQDDFGAWMLGSISRRTAGPIGGGPLVVTEETTFDARMQPETVKAFGLVAQSFTYNPDGTIATLSDGRDTAGFDTTVSMSNYKRGTPQLITFPATPEAPGGATQLAVVNDVGWITSTTDELGYTTTFGYDEVGRPKWVKYPVGDSVAYNDTNFSFGPVGAAFGLPAGHWARSITTGTSSKTTHYDAMWRPIVSDVVDTADQANTRAVVVKRYDADGRVVFESLPARTVADFAALSQGQRISYDALGRFVRKQQDSELGVLERSVVYLDGFMREETDEHNKVTTEAFQAFEAPSFDAPVLIDRPENTRSTIIRDLFGKPIEITRGTAN